MDAAAFKRWLKTTMGLDAEAVGPGVIERAIAGRMRAVAAADADAYWRRLQAQPLEQQELIEAVVVPETWFFRGVEAFDALARAFAPRLGEPGAAPVRLLSLPCSTGEEPYTLAMALLDAGWPPQRLRIDAYDISERALAKAGHAVYGANSFRGGDLRYRERHFRALGHGRWQLSDAVRGCVRLHRANVLDIDFLPDAASFDAVFCRNLLIYFDQDTQVRTVGVLARALAADGLLFVGAAETGLLLSLGYASAQIPMAAAFRNQRGAPAPPPATPSPWRAPALAPLPAAAARARPFAAAALAARPAPTAPAAAAAPAQAADDSLQQARRLADNGDFAQAERLCQAHLRAHGPNAEALCLLGVIYGADGADARAEDAFRKALYLQPDHAESLMHLALLLDSKGDAAGARLMRQRAARHRGRNA
ncbi:chemotaxis protein methyltransferase WspC [Lysobacter sp. yr284]|uniref:CheR family methyltransferase n=1 Tax=Lysobacter sp. yr284 TaxID=1761791 RepID=UPI00089C2A92|nr:protein-glutamate O-methyltransferase CheR [Lysobacter sp. yr284]SDY56197.1 chemotaxis protein methyltransferase WspC [Lysobacter sp. yr284]